MLEKVLLGAALTSYSRLFMLRLSDNKLSFLTAPMLLVKALSASLHPMILIIAS